MSRRALEQYRLFPFIAWGLVAGFAFFVYTLAMELTATATALEEQTTILEIRANQNPSTLTDFERY
jgi:hypothetical protein